MLLTGKLEKLDFADLLQMLAGSGKSGKLSLTQPGGQGVIVLRQGRIVYAASSSVRETLGNMLLCKGLITEAQLQEGLALQRDSRVERRLGAILVDRGVISPEALRTVVVEQFERVVLEIFEWNRGFFRFEDLEVPDRGEVEVDAHEFLLADGLAADQVLLGTAVRLDEDKAVSAQRAATKPAAAKPKSPIRRPSPSDPLPPAIETTPRETGRLGSLKSVMSEFHAPEFTGELTLAILNYAQKLVHRGVLFRSNPLGFAGVGQFGIETPTGAGADFVRGISLPLEGPSILREAIARKEAFRGILEETEVNRALMTRLGGGWPSEVVAAPLLVNGRALLIFYGDNLPGNEPIGPVDELEVVLLHAGLAMEKNALAKKIERLEALDSPPTPVTDRALS